MKKLSRSYMARSIFFMLAITVTFVVLFTIFGCKNEQIVAPNANTPSNQMTKTLKMSGVSDVKGKFTVQDGVLHFEDSKTFHDILAQLSEYDITEIKKFGKNIGFKSMLSAFDDVLEKCSEIQDSVAYEALLAQNSDILIPKQDGRFGYKIPPFLAMVTNRKGIVYIGKAVYKFTDWGEIISLDGDVNRLDVVTKATKSDKNIKVFVTQNEVEQRAGCGLSEEAHQTVDNSRAGDLMVKLTNFTTVDGTVNGVNTFRVSCGLFLDVIAWKRSCILWSCSWNKYKTILETYIDYAFVRNNGTNYFHEMHYNTSPNSSQYTFIRIPPSINGIPEPDVSQYNYHIVSLTPARFWMPGTGVDMTIWCN